MKAEKIKKELKQEIEPIKAKIKKLKQEFDEEIEKAQRTF